MDHYLFKFLLRNSLSLKKVKAGLSRYGAYPMEVTNSYMSQALAKEGQSRTHVFQSNIAGGFWQSETIWSAPTYGRWLIASSPSTSHQCKIVFQCRSTSSRGQTAYDSGIIEVPLAQTGEGIADCELLTWHVQEGDYVEEFQPLCDVQSDKATVQITSRYKGKITQIKFLPGAIVKVGEALVEMLIDDKASVHEPCLQVADDNFESVSTFVNPLAGSSKTGPDEDQKVLTTPAVRNLARSYGINLHEVTGSGTDGRILKEDVLKFAAAKEGLHEELSAIAETHVKSNAEPNAIGSDVKLETSSTMKSPCLEDEVIPIRGFRRSMVKTMTAAAKVPHLHYMEELNMDALVRLRTSLKHIALERKIKLTYLSFLIKALSMALYKHPLVNSTVNDDISEIRCKASHNVGVAIGKEAGLAVPNIKNVQHLSVFEIAGELARLSQLATDNKLSPDDLSGGTITVSNFGAIGGKFGCPILNLPEVAILGIGRVQKLPRLDSSGHIYPASIMSITWGADHRIIDGATIANLCNDWKLLVEEPERLIVNLR